MAETKIQSFKDLIVWQKATDLVIKIYDLTQHFPKEELYGLSSQMRRCAVSIPSNIAEGSNRGTRKDFSQFLRIAYGSGAELETQIEISKRLSFSGELDYNVIDTTLNEIMKMLVSLIKKLKTVN